MLDTEGKVKILVAGCSASIHTARFVCLLQEIGYDVRLFESENNYFLDEHLKDTILYVNFRRTRSKSSPNSVIVKGRFFIIDFIFSDVPFVEQIYQLLINYKEIFTVSPSRVKHLNKIILKWKPDIVFSLKMQADGYTVSEAKEKLGDKFLAKWIHYNWGTDIEFFGKHKDYVDKHLPIINKLLSLCDFHIADCQRDARQVFEYGFKGISLGSYPAHGGFDLSEEQVIKAQCKEQKRNVILVKGREGGLVGHALNILAALQKTPSHILKNYRIKVILASPDVKAVCQYLSQNYGQDYEIVPRVSYKELLVLFSQSRITLSASDVDGTPVFLLESMAFGAFPIHSDMDSIREWIDDGENGLLFPVNDINVLSQTIERALTDDRLVEKARKINWSITQEKVDRKIIKKQIKEIIEQKVLGYADNNN